MLEPHPDTVKRRNGWRITPPVTRMMSEVVKLEAVLQDSCRSSVDQALRSNLPTIIRELRKRCKADGINPDRVLESTVCSIDNVTASRARFKLNNPPSTPPKPPTTAPKRASKVNPLDYQSAPMRDLPADSTE